MSISQNSAALNLQRYPPDLLLEIVSHLELADLLSFIKVCSSFRKLSESRFLWIGVLERTRHLRSLAYPFASDLVEADVESLRRVAYTTHRLERNWSSDSPKIVRPVKSVPYSTPNDSATIICNILGTSMVVLYTSVTQAIVCCDLDGDNLNRHLRSVIGGNLLLYTCKGFQGNQVIALLTKKPADNFDTLHVISIKHGIGRETTLDVIYSTKVPFGCHELFMRDDVVFALTHSTSEDNFLIYAFNYVKHMSRTLVLEVENIVSENASICCLVLDKLPYFDILVSGVNFNQNEVYRGPVSLLDFDWDAAETDPPKAFKLPLIASVEIPEVDSDIDVTAILSSWSPHGIRTASVHFDDDYTQTACIHLRYWCSTLLEENPIGSPAELVIPGKVGSYVDDPKAEWLFDTTFVGVYALTVIDRSGEIGSSDSPPSSLELVHFVEGRSEILTRKLDLPFYINLDDIYSVALDENYGVVYLSHCKGHLFALYYA